MRTSKRFARPVSDRRKVMIVVIALTIATMAIVALVTVHDTRDRLVSRTDSTLENQLEISKVAMNVLSPGALRTLRNINRIVPSDIGYSAFGSGERPVSSVPTQKNGRNQTVPLLPARAELQHRIGQPFDAQARDGTRYRVLIGSLPGGAVIAYFTPLTALDQTVHDLRNTAIAVGVAAIALLSLLLWFLLSALTRPIEAMVDAATKIGDGDLTARVPAKAVRGDARRLGDALNQMVTRLELAAGERARAEERLRQFIADASHELRSPLTNVRGYSQLLLMGGAADADKPLALQRIAEETARMSRLVDDMLLLARLDQRRRSLHGEVDAGEVLRGVVLDARVVEPNRPIALDLPADPAIVLGDADALRRAVGNLLVNVRVHTTPATPCTVAARTRDESIVISVSDDGPGMSAEDAASAFDRFFRADLARSRATGGTGLGLAICKAIVEDLGGSLTLTTRPGAGVHVEIVLPRTRATRDPRRAARSKAVAP